MEDPFGTKKGPPKGLPSGTKKPAGTEIVRSGSGPGTALDRPAASTALDRAVGTGLTRRDVYKKAAVERPVKPKSKKRVCILLDGTGSMGWLIATAKERIKAIMEQSWSEGEDVEIMLVVYRDYDMGSQVMDHSECTGDHNALLHWLGSVEVAGGGSNLGEAVEVGLKFALDNGPWDAIFISGDEPAHEAGELQSMGHPGPTAVELARQMGKGKRIPIYTFVVEGHHRQTATEKNFADISEASGAVTGKLDGSEAMIHMVSMALLVSGKSGRQAAMDVSRYVEAHKKQLSAGSAAFARQLLLQAGKK